MVKQKQYTRDLKDEEWILLKPYLLKLMLERRRGRKTGYELRELLDAVRYTLRSGCT